MLDFGPATPASLPRHSQSQSPGQSQSQRPAAKPRTTRARARTAAPAPAPAPELAPALALISDTPASDAAGTSALGELPSGTPAEPMLARGSAATPVPMATPVAAEPLPDLVALTALQRVLVFDVETTGTDKRNDQVIELCVQYGLDGSQSKTWRFKPSCAINPGAQAVHGISMDELADCPSFGDGADEILAIFAEADVVIGYNVAFDIDMLQSEFERLRRPGIDFSGKTIVDAFRLWQQCEPRSLQHAHKRFVGDSFDAAHSASADVAATARVLEGMLRAFGLHDRDWTAIADVCDPTRASWVGPSRHLQWDADGAIIITFGKHSGAQLHVLACSKDSGYLAWVADKDFPAHVIEICKKAIELGGDEFLAWARRRYGQPAPTAAPPFAGRS
jgi:DNA polymerase-3 subunit epsilon